MTQFLNHLHIVLHALLDTLGLDGVALFLEEGHLFHQVVLNQSDGHVCLFLSGGKEVGGVELIFLKRGQSRHVHAVQLFYGVYLVVPEGDAQNSLRIGHCYIHRIALHAKASTLQFQVVTDI